MMGKADKSAVPASLVSSLMSTTDSDEALSEFRRENMGADSDMSLEQLRTARHVLQALALGAGEEQLDADDERPTEKPPESDLPPTLARPPLAKPAAPPSIDELALAAEIMAKREVPFEGRSMSAPVYAVLCATCGAFPGRVRETHAKFGIPNEEVRSTLDDAWQRCFDEEPRLRELWDALFKQFRAWLIQYGGV
jgi:hypothetical protein